MSRHSTRRLKIRYVEAGGVDRLVLAEEAGSVAFESCRPVRVIPAYHGQRHTPGWYWSATTGGLLAYESFLERQWLTLLDFDAPVTAIATQALELHGTDAAGDWRHVPDIFTRRADGSVLIVDVKNPRRRHDPRVVQQAERTASACDRIGWAYEMVTVPPSQRYANVAWLAGYRRPLRAASGLTASITTQAAAQTTVAELAAATGAPELARPVIFHLLWCQQLVCDLDTPLSERTGVRGR
ncbi:hypothetical protein CcI49_32920 [Frankia sp. CcI49]|uniref:TnsA-like heteromeric transposase endonuclease subunit n=1 Tax=Frankia sp. CcI49 TaxID=1745382 RepID=UPI000976E0BD|nr:TnsA-like heteromeric transposase endonuclease subunit [Frankia sp. CcI49]ONH52931.1 hypothetical protein CcI49_32920 [Frankia sp. CcI49]